MFNFNESTKGWSWAILIAMGVFGLLVHAINRGDSWAAGQLNVLAVLMICSGGMHLLNHKVNERLQKVKAELEELRAAMSREQAGATFGSSVALKNELPKDDPAPLPETSIAPRRSKWW